MYYRENEIQHKGKYRGGSVTAPKLGRYVYVQALVDDYLLTGDPRSREVAGFMAEFFVKNFSPKKAFYAKKSQRFWTERLFAFPFLGILSYYELSLDHKYLKVADTYMENLYKTQLEWPSRGGFIHNLYAHDPEEGARRDEYGGSPFMTGLLLEAVVKYHQITKSEIAADSIFRALDWLIREGLTNQGDSFKYLTADRYAASDGEPDLNLLIVHALGYGYRLSGYKQESYVETGLKVFERGVRDAYLGRRKHFNQNYRSSGHFLAYIDQGLRQKEILKSSAQPIVSENETSTEKKEISRDTIFYYEGFEFSVGRFESPGAVAGISVDNQMRFKGRRSVLIQSKAELSDLSAGINWDRWQLERYSNMHLAYRIPPETPVGLRVKTQYGDWICLGGTKNFLCAGTPVTHRELLTDDGAWHEINIDVQALVTSLLPGINNLTGFQFHTNGNARRNNRFWIDEFIILK